MQVAFTALVAIIVLAVVFFSWIATESNKNFVVNNLTDQTKNALQMVREPDPSLTWNPAARTYGDPTQIKYNYDISLKDMGIKNPGKTPAYAVAVIKFKGEVASDETQIIKVPADEQDYFNFNFKIESGEPPLVKASDIKTAGVISDDKSYVIGSNENKKLGDFYSVSINDFPAVLGKQAIVVNDFMIRASPFALRVWRITLSKCQVSVIINCKNEMQTVMLKDFYRRVVGLTNDPCESDPDNVCEKSVNMCDRTLELKLIRTDRGCDSIENIEIRTTGSLTDEDRKKYQLGETAVISFWKPGSECWKEPLTVRPGCEDAFYGAFDILIPADNYNKEGTTPPVPVQRECANIDASDECTTDDYGNECYWTVWGICKKCSPDILKCDELNYGDCTTEKCGVKGCTWNPDFDPYGCFPP